MTSASSMPSLNQRQDLKSLLECSICLETFDDPRTLPCLHSFCKKCLENFVDEKRDDELNCPVCRCRFTLDEEGVAGIMRIHFICNMVEVLSIQDHDKCIPCSHCEQPSAGRCVTCELFMCEKCIQSHNGYLGFRDHVVLTMEELSKPENHSKIKGKSYCKKHSSKKLKLYCETCEELICTYCVVFQHVRPDHVCLPLEEIAERKRKELKTICQTLENNEKRTTQLYDDLAITSFYLDQNLEAVKRNIHDRKNRVMRLVNSVLEKKAQCLIQETENIAKEKNRAIDDELICISEHKAGQRKVYDTAMALVNNGSNEEIMLSHKSVEQSLENGAKEYEQTAEIDDQLSKYNDGQLDNVFFNEINKTTQATPKNPPRRMMNRSDDCLISDDCIWFDLTTGKLIVKNNPSRSQDNCLLTGMAAAGWNCGADR